MKILDRSSAPRMKPFHEINLIAPEHYKLSNAIPVYQFNAGTQDLARIELIFDAGTWYQNKPFVAYATNKMLRETSKKFTSQQIAEQFDFFGAHLENAAERDKAVVTLYTLNKYLPETLSLLEEIVKNPIFIDSDFAVIAQKQKQLLSVNLQKINYLARIHFNAMLYGEKHSYGAFLAPEQIKDVSTSDLKSFHKKYYNSANCKIIVSGRISPQMQPLLEKTFGGKDWSGKPAESQKREMIQLDEKERFIEKKDALQSALRVGKVLFTKDHADFIDFQILNTILGGYFGSRLISNLREEKGYTYGIGSDLVVLQHSGYFFVSSEVKASHTKNALKEIYSELERLTTELVSEKELKLVQNYLCGSLMHAIDGPFAMADRFRELIDFDLDTTWIKIYLDKIKSISPQKICALAQNYLAPDSMKQVVVGDLSNK